MNSLCGQLIYDKGGKKYNEVKTVYSIMVLRKWGRHMQKKETESSTVQQE